MGADGVPDFNALQNAFDKSGMEDITYFVFDLLFLNGKDLRDREFQERRSMLEVLFADSHSDRVRLSQTFDADGTSVLESACKMGLEGVVAKRLNAPYRSGRTKTWLKVKCQLRQEFVVGGFVSRTGSGKEIGSLLLGVYDTGDGCAMPAVWEPAGILLVQRRYCRAWRSLKSTGHLSIWSSPRPRDDGASVERAASAG